MASMFLGSNDHSRILTINSFNLNSSSALWFLERRYSRPRTTALDADAYMFCATSRSRYSSFMSVRAIA